MNLLKIYLKDKGFFTMIALQVITTFERHDLINRNLHDQNIEVVTELVSWAFQGLVVLIWYVYHHHAEKRASGQTVATSEPLEEPPSLIQSLFSFLYEKLRLSQYITTKNES